MYSSYAPVGQTLVADHDWLGAHPAVHPELTVVQTLKMKQLDLTLAVATVAVTPELPVEGLHRLGRQSLSHQLLLQLLEPVPVPVQHGIHRRFQFPSNEPDIATRNLE